MHRLALPALAAAALILAACGSSTSGYGGAAGVPPSARPGTAASGGTLKTTTIHGATVLTNIKGFTLYSFAPGQANGNGVNAFGGLWHAVTPSGAAAPTPSSGGGGNGY